MKNLIPLLILTVTLFCCLTHIYCATAKEELTMKDWQTISPDLWIFEFNMPSSFKNRKQDNSSPYGNIERDIFSASWGDTNLSATKSKYPMNTENAIEIDIDFVKNLTRFIEKNKTTGVTGQHKYVRINAGTQEGPRPLRLECLWIEHKSTVYSFSTISEIYAKEDIDKFFSNVNTKK